MNDMEKKNVLPNVNAKIVLKLKGLTEHVRMAAFVRTAIKIRKHRI